jgi:tetratricopeptide (TPR) repeat protein
LAGYKKKRRRELRQDAFRENTIHVFDRLGDLLEGKGRQVIYGLAGVILLGIAVWGFVAWRGKKEDEARRALGRGIEITQASVSRSDQPDPTRLSFTDERDRSQRAIDEFQKVANKYGGRTGKLAKYFIATNLLITDRSKGVTQLESLAKDSDDDIAARSKFALAGAYEADGKLDQAAALYRELAAKNNGSVPVDTANLRLATVLEKQGKVKDASDILFDLVSTSRKAQDKDGKPLAVSAASRDAEQALERLDPSRYAQLPPPPAPAGFPI